MALTKISGGVIQQPIDVGIITATSATFSGNVSIAGTLTYEDVTNIDSVGLITARSGIHVTGVGSSVGIGTDNPRNNIQVCLSTPITVPSAGTSGHNAAIGDVGFGVAIGAINSGKSYIQGTRWDGTALNYDLLLQPNGGSVGIGTVNPTDSLTILKDATGAGAGGLKLQTAGSNESYLTFGVSSSLSKAIFTSSFNGSGTALPMVFAVGPSSTDERLRITSTGNVGIGTDNPSYKLDVLEDSSNVARFSRTGGQWAKVNISAGLTNGNSYITFGDPDGEESGAINYEHLDDSLRFETWNGTSKVERLRITTNGDTQVAAGSSLYLANGNLVFSTAGTGIDFSATTDASGMTSELLDDYEEGTWTPTSETGTIVSTSANYTKIGNIVHINAYIDDWSDITSDTTVQIQSLPYAGVDNDSNVGCVMYRYIDDTDGIGGDLALFMTNGTSLRFYFQNSVGDSNYAALKHKDINGTTSSFRIQMTYRVA